MRRKSYCGAGAINLGMKMNPKTIKTRRMGIPIPSISGTLRSLAILKLRTL
jgi:hypothetical protein